MTMAPKDWTQRGVERLRGHWHVDRVAEDVRVGDRICLGDLSRAEVRVAERFGQDVYLAVLDSSSANENDFRMMFLQPDEPVTVVLPARWWRSWFFRAAYRIGFRSVATR